MNEQQIMQKFDTSTAESASARVVMLETLWAFERLEMHEWLVGPWMGTLFHDGLKKFALEGLKEAVGSAAVEMRRAANWLDDAERRLDTILIEQEITKKLAAQVDAG